MDEKEIVLSYLKRGRLIAPNALAAIGRGVVPSQTASLVITETELPRDDAKILKNLTEKKKELTTEDFAAFYASKFNQMQGIIMSRLQKDFVSLNKIGADRREVYVIGMVREIKEKDGKTVLDVEDMTTSLPVSFDEKPEVDLDDVIAIKATAGGKVLFGKQVIYPDVPLRQPKTGSGRACFVSDLHLNESPLPEAERFFAWFSSQDIKYLFVAGDFGGIEAMATLVQRYCTGKAVFIIPGENDTSDSYPQLPVSVSGATCLSNPGMVEINGINVLLVHSLPESALRKRYLGKSIPMHEDFLPLTEVPDIVHCGHTHKPHVSNYKAITIVNSGSLLDEFRPVVIDLATREVVQVNI